MRYYIVQENVYVSGYYTECMYDEHPDLGIYSSEKRRLLRKGGILIVDDNNILRIDNEYGHSIHGSQARFDCTPVLHCLKEVTEDYALCMEQILDLYEESERIGNDVMLHLSILEDEGLSKEDYEALSIMLDESVEVFLECLRKVPGLYSVSRCNN